MKGTWMESFWELVSGEAFRPDMCDRSYTIASRQGNQRLLVVQVCSEQWVMSRCEPKAKGVLSWSPPHTIPSRDQTEFTKGLSVYLRGEDLRWAIVVQDFGWEVQRLRSPAKVGGVNRNEQILSTEGGHSPRELEEGQWGTIVSGPKGKDGLLFSVPRSLVEPPLEILASFGLEIVRCQIGMAALLERILHSPGPWKTKEGQIMVESRGGALLIDRSGDRMTVMGQWSQEITANSSGEAAPEWINRLPDSEHPVWIFSDRESTATNADEAVKRFSRQKPPPPGWILTSPVWDPPQDLLQDLDPRPREIRPCLHRRWRFLRPTALGGLLLLLSGWGWQWQSSWEVQRELREQEEVVTAIKSEIRSMEEEMGIEQQRIAVADQMGNWVRGLVSAAALAPGFLKQVPEEVFLGSFSLRSFQGQRQIEVVMDLQGNREQIQDLVPEVLEHWDRKGFRLVSLSQPDSGDGVLFKAIFLVPL